MVHADRLGPKVGGHLAPCCIHHVNQGELSQRFKHNDSTIKIVLVLMIIIIIIMPSVSALQDCYQCAEKNSTDALLIPISRIRIALRVGRRHNVNFSRFRGWSMVCVTLAFYCLLRFLSMLHTSRHFYRPANRFLGKRRLDVSE